jgi:signal transduction histidine kinase
VWAAWLNAVLWVFGPPLLPLLGLVFPDGHPLGRVGRWAVRAALGGIGLAVVGAALAPGPLAGFSDTPGPANPIGLAVLSPAVPVIAVIVAALLLGAAAAAVFTLGRRWWRGSAGDRLGIAATATPLVVAIVLTVAAQVFGLGGDLVAGIAAILAAVGVPAGIGLAATRFRLYRLDLAITGTLAYAIVLAALAAVYVVTATLVGLLIGRDSPVTVAAATATSAATFAPLHGRLRRWVRRRVLGLAGDPELAAVEVARRLAAVEDPDQMESVVAASVSDLLKAPAAQVLQPGEVGPGTQADLTGVSLTHHGIALGVLVVPGPLPASARRALLRMAEPVAAALHAAALTEAVRRSRADLLAAVEDERRRLRRDLHDDLGPRLATLGMGLDAVANRAAGTTAEPVVLPALARLRDQSEGMLADLRRIVSGLRPPALDDLGLVAAVRLQATEVAQPAGLTVDVVSDELGSLPAAVEVAAYRIAVEAVMNASKHSHGRYCRVSLRWDGGLRLAIRDDGVGMTTGGSPGVGMQSMRERAAAVGGWVVVAPAEPHGTEVRAWLPEAL